MEKCLIMLHFHCLVHFSHKIEKFQFLKSLKYLNSVFYQIKMSDLIVLFQTMSDLV